MKKVITAEAEKLLERAPELAAVIPAFKTAAAQLIELYRRGGTLFVAGNGGSAADADHICGELLKGFKSKRPLPEAVQQEFAARFGEEGTGLAGKLQSGLPAVSLLSHPGLATAFANDVDPNLPFAQQLWALARKGDLFLGISTGGNAVNIKAALMAARVKGVQSILLTGNRHGVCERYADLVIAVPEGETYLIQEQHIKIYHALCLAVERAQFP